MKISGHSERTRWRDAAMPLAIDAEVDGYKIALGLNIPQKKILRMAQFHKILGKHAICRAC